MGRRTFVWCAALAAILVSSATADSTDTPAGEKKKEVRRAESGKKTTERKSAVPQVEKTVLRMVQAHLPEIEVLLDRLREKEPQQYDAAIRDLSKSSRRLQIAKKRGAEALEIEVQIVKAQSATNLLIAKLRVRDNEKDRKALLKAAETLRQAELARAQYEHDMLRDRLTRMQKQFDASEKRLKENHSKSPDAIEKAYLGYLRKAGRKPKK